MQGIKTHAWGQKGPLAGTGGRAKLFSVLRASCIATVIVIAAIGVTPPAGADPSADLMGMLPAGYGSDSCEPADLMGALAALNCRDNSLPGGPTYATYQLFGDRRGMHDAFAAYLKRPEWAPATCPGMQSSDATAMVGSNGEQYGLIACGRGTGPDWSDRDGAVAWTQDPDHFLGVAYVGYQGQEFPASLFEWARSATADFGLNRAPAAG